MFTTQLESVDTYQVQILAPGLEAAKLPDHAVFGAFCKLRVKKSTLLDIKNLIGVFPKDWVSSFGKDQWQGLVAEAIWDEKGFLY